MTADLSALIARLEAAEVGSRELDWDIGAALFTGVRGCAAPNATTSLDAALELVKKVLPGWLWDVTTITTAVGGLRKPLASVVRPDQPEGEEIKTWGYGSTPALALCIAILRAKQGEGG